MHNTDMVLHAKDFHLWFYRWSLEDHRNEMLSGYQTVRKIRGPLAARFLDFVDTLHPKEVELLPSALVKRFHGQVVPVATEELTAAEQSLIKRYLDWDWPGSQAWDINKSPTRFNRRNIHGLLSNISSLGTDNSDSDLHDIRIVQRFGSFELKTLVDFDSRAAELGYSHALRYKGELIRERISILDWLGIAGSTIWLAGRASPDEIVQTIGQIAGRFRNGFERFLERQV